jgi:hypothetical protein
MRGHSAAAMIAALLLAGTAAAAHAQLAVSAKAAKVKLVERTAKSRHTNLLEGSCDGKPLHSPPCAHRTTRSRSILSAAAGAGGGRAR